MIFLFSAECTQQLMVVYSVQPMNDILKMIHDVFKIRVQEYESSVSLPDYTAELYLWKLQSLESETSYSKTGLHIVVAMLSQPSQ